MATYPIDPDVRRIASRFAGIALSFRQLLAAVVRTEGNIIQAVKCTYKDVADKDTALDITARSAVHAMSDFIYQDKARREAFIDQWAGIWAPRKVQNDPTDLNRNWPTNMKKFWTPDA